MKVNQHTYENYFLLYIDNELTASEKAEVESFIQAYPHYATILQDLKNTIQSVEIIPFNDKFTLYQLSESDDQCLTYLENEMGERDKYNFEQTLAKAPSLKNQLHHWEQTILKKEAALELPSFFKQGLYKKTEAPIRTLHTWRTNRTYISIAALFLLVIGYAVLQPSNITRQSKANNKAYSAEIVTTPVQKKGTLSQSLESLPAQNNLLAKNIERKNINLKFSNIKTTVSVKYNNESKRNTDDTHSRDEKNISLSESTTSKALAMSTIVEQPTETNIPYNKNDSDNKHTLIETTVALTSEIDIEASEINNKVEQFKNIDVDEEERTIYIGNIELDGSAFRGVTRRIASLFKRSKIEKEK